MKLRKLSENKLKFNYEITAQEMWREELKKAKEEFKIDFDTENDEDIAIRRLKFSSNSGLQSIFVCELRHAGGDWQLPIAYFRCQITEGMAGEYSTYNHPYFCYIPGPKEGNPHLTKTKRGWSAPDAESVDKQKPDDKLCWKSLESYLQQLTKKPDLE